MEKSITKLFPNGQRSNEKLASIRMNFE